MMDDIPDLPREALEQFTDAELVAYVEMLEDKRRDMLRRSFKAYARAIPLPGAPDPSNIVATDWERALALEKGKELPPNNEDDTVEFYGDRLAVQPHQDLVMDKMQELVEGDLVNEYGEEADGVMIFMPPGSAKSSVASMLAPSYFMGRFPGFEVILASYAQSLANRFSRRVQSICNLAEYQEIFGVMPKKGNEGVEEWAMTHESRMRSAGVLAGITGFRCDLLIIDDVVKNAEDADSQVIRDKIWEEWETSLSTRFKGKDRIALIMTRWHQDDLAGRILDNGKDKWTGQSGFWRGADKRLWYIVCIPMIASQPDDPLGRKIGEQLWPEKFSPRNVAMRRAKAEEKGGARDWTALYQQQPTAMSGNIVKREWWQKWTKRDEYGPIPPECSAVYLFYDTAFEAKETADYSAMTAWGIFERVVRTPGGREFNHHQAVLLTSWQERVDAVELPKIIKKHTERFEKGGTSVEIFVEGRASGKQIIQELRRMRLPVREWLPKGPKGALGKVPRTHAATFPFESGCIWYIPSAETLQVIDQVSDFPNAPHDDLHDTVTMAMDIFRRRFLVQMPSDELDDDEYEEDVLRRRAEKKRLENRRLYG
jgi:phage terminase large subunit-like protein